MAIYGNKSINRGFTLIELLVVFSVIITLSVVGIAAFVDYSRAQTVQSSANELATMLQTAKSKAQSQVALDNDGKTNLCGLDSLIGYEVRLCSLSGSACINTKGNDYELNIVCSSSNGNRNSPRDSKKLPGDLRFDPTSGNTTADAFLFYTSTGGISATRGALVMNGYRVITIQGYIYRYIFGQPYYGINKIIQIDPGGNIRVR